MSHFRMYRYCAKRLKAARAAGNARAASFWWTQKIVLSGKLAA